MHVRDEHRMTAVCTYTGGGEQVAYIKMFKDVEDDLIGERL